MKVREVLKMLEQDGWYLDRTRGSHRQLKHPQNWVGHGAWQTQRWFGARHFQ
jgi:hypothetical protein